MGNCFLYKRGGSSGGGSLVVFAKTVRGKFITLTNSAAKPFKGLRVFGKTTQNGTPTPDAPVPLESVGDSGYVDVNIVGNKITSVITYNMNAAQGRVAVNLDAPATSPLTTSAWRGVSIAVPVIPNTQYTATSDVTPCEYFNVTYYKDMKSITDTGNAISFIQETRKNTITFNTPPNCWAIVITSFGSTSATYEWSWWQVEQSSAATSYEPDKKVQTLPISTPNCLPGIPVDSGGNYTDEDGQQWICDEFDFEKGVYVQRIYRTIFNSATGWGLASTTNGLNRFFTNKYMSFVKGTESVKTKGNIFCSHFSSVTAEDTWYEKTGISINESGRLDIYYSGIEQTISALEEFFANNPVTFIAELATPIETPLTAEELTAYAALHTNLPNTIIYNDAGADMEVKYTSIGG